MNEAERGELRKALEGAPKEAILQYRDKVRMQPISTKSMFLPR